LCGFIFITGITTASAQQLDIPLMKQAQQRKPLFIQELGSLVNMDSGTDDAKGLDRVEGILSKRLKELGAEVEIHNSASAAGRTVVGKLRGNGTKKIMLLIHYDTVFGVGEAIKRPFKVVDQKAYGPGVADAKGGVLMILNALDILKERQFKGYQQLTVMFNPDEEKGSMGSLPAIESLSKEQDVVLVFEPPEADHVTVGTNGIVNIYLDVKGRSSHAGSAPERGRNAVIELSHQLLQLNALGDPIKGTTVNWTVVKTGDRINIIPDSATAIADMRLSDATETARVQTDIDRIIQKQLVADTKVSVVMKSVRLPFVRNSASDALAKKADLIYSELGKHITPVVMRYGTDAGFAYNPESPNKPIVLDGMGIVGNALHTSDEWADLDSIIPRLYLTVRMIESISGER
jgi:glutamate carboxypeptidase